MLQCIYTYINVTSLVLPALLFLVLKFCPSCQPCNTATHSSPSLCRERNIDADCPFECIQAKDTTVGLILDIITLDSTFASPQLIELHVSSKQAAIFLLTWVSGNEALDPQSCPIHITLRQYYSKQGSHQGGYKYHNWEGSRVAQASLKMCMYRYFSKN